MDCGTARHHDAAVVCDRYVAWCAARLARCATLDALDHAAAMGAACDSVLSARSDPHIPVGLPDPVAADLRWLYRRRDSVVFDWLRMGCCIARAAAGVVNRIGGDRR